MRHLVYDTETTGMVDFNARSTAEHQPHLVQLGALIYNDELDCIEQSVDLIVCPDGWTISDEAIEVHGITNEHAEKFGSPEHQIINIFAALVSKVDGRVGHNLSFDDKITRIALKRNGLETLADKIKDTQPGFCTMKNSKNIVKAPLTEKQRERGIKGYKMPKLEEAFLHFFGREMKSAHNAMADAKACLDVYKKIKSIS